MSDQPRGIRGMALADTPKGRYLIHDDEPAAAPDVFDTRTCQEKHSDQVDALWVALTDARLRIANLERIVAKLERIIAEWSAGK